MKIKSIEAIPIKSKPSQPRESALGIQAEFEYGIVIIKTDSNIEGYGEISTLWDGSGKRACYDVNHILAPTLIGENPFNIVKIIKKMDRQIEFSRSSNPAKAAIEMALYDIVGKKLNTPVYNLLGGKVRECIPLSISIFMENIEGMVEQAIHHVEKGFKTLKIKIGMDQEHDIAVVREIRKAVGESINIRVDANMGWSSAKQAISVIQKLEEYNVHSIEQPMAPERLEEISLIRNQVKTPIMLDESIWGPTDTVLALKEKSADIFNVYVSESGGLYNAATIFRMAESFGVEATIGSMPELGIGTAAQIHLAVSVPSFNCPGDVCGFLYHKEDIILENIRVEDGFVYPIDSPGLGVTLDYDKLDSFRID